MESVYLESSFISYLVSRPSRDLIVSAHQQISQEWWEIRRFFFHLYISEPVLAEISVGDSIEIEKRINIVENISILSASDEAERLTKLILKENIIPEKAATDAAHIAIASSHKMDYLLTWNCKHLANAQIVRRIQDVFSKCEVELPIICTPEELMGEENA